MDLWIPVGSRTCLFLFFFLLGSMDSTRPWCSRMRRRARQRSSPTSASCSGRCRFWSFMAAAPHASPSAPSSRRYSIGGRIQRNLETISVIIEVENFCVDSWIALGSRMSHLSLFFLWGFMDSTSPEDVGLPYMTDVSDVEFCLILVTVSVRVLSHSC